MEYLPIRYNLEVMYCTYNNSSLVALYQVEFICKYQRVLHKCEYITLLFMHHGDYLRKSGDRCWFVK